MSFKLVDRIETLFGYQTVGQTKSHRGIIGPFSRLQVEWASSDYIIDWSKCAWGSKFERSSKGIPDGEPENGTAIALDYFHNIITLFVLREDKGFGTGIILFN
jgi:hypothetical protein